MSKYLNATTGVVVALLVAGFVAFGYATNRVSLGNVMFLVILAVAFGLVAAIFLKKMTHPDVSVEQMLHDTDHPKRT